MNRRILVATGLTVVALALASMANGTIASHETSACTRNDSMDLLVGHHLQHRQIDWGHSCAQIGYANDCSR
jgi:hypothetical protein